MRRKILNQSNIEIFLQVDTNNIKLKYIYIYIYIYVKSAT